MSGQHYFNFHDPLAIHIHFSPPVASSCSIVRERASQYRSTRSAWRWQRKRACPNSSITCCQEPKDSGWRFKTSGAQVRPFPSIECGVIMMWRSNPSLISWLTSSPVAAVYDLTLNFRNNETPSLLGILRGKKYHPALYVRYERSKTKNTLRETASF